MNNIAKINIPISKLDNRNSINQAKNSARALLFPSAIFPSIYVYNPTITSICD